MTVRHWRGRQNIQKKKKDEELMKLLQRFLAWQRENREVAMYSHFHGTKYYIVNDFHLERHEKERRLEI